MFRRYIVGLCFFACVNVNAQTKFTLDECVNYALAHNTDLKDTRLQQKEADLDLKYQKHKFLPSAQATINNGLKTGRQPDALGKYRGYRNYYNEATFDASIPLFAPDASVCLVKKYRLDAEIAKLSSEYKELEVKLNVLENYYGVAIAKIRYNISLEQVALQDSVYDITKKLFQIGRKAKKDVIDAELNLSQDKYSALQEKNNVESSLIKLANAMNFKETLEVVTAQNGYLLPALSFDEVADKIEHKHPYIELAEKRVESSEKERKAYVRQLFPSLSLDYEFGTGAARYYDEKNRAVQKQWENNAYHVLALSLKVPLFNQLNTKTQIQRSKVQVERSREQLEKAKEDLRNEIEMVWTDIQQANNSLDNLKTTAKLADEQYKLATKDYRLGNIASYELNVYKNKYISSILQLAQVQCELEYKYQVLKYFME